MPLVGGHGFSKTARLSPSQAVGADVIRHSQYFYPVRPAGRGYYFAVGCEWYFYIRPGETAVKIIRPAFAHCRSPILFQQYLKIHRFY